LIEWFGAQGDVRLMAGFLFLGLLALFFYRAGRGAGWTLFALLAAGLTGLFTLSPALHLLLFLPLAALLGLNEWHLRRYGEPYQPARALVETGGVKRGLTGPEAAALLEAPVQRVLCVVLAALLKKGLVEEDEGDPWRLAVAPAFRVRELAAGPRQRAELRREAARRQAVVMHGYEDPFLELLEAGGGAPVQEQRWGVPLRLLVQGVVARVGPYNLEKTRAYYRKVAARARKDARSVVGEAWQDAVLDHHLEWLLLEPSPQDVWLDWPDYQPSWRRVEVLDPQLAPIPGQGPTPFADWLANALEACAAALRADGLRAREPGGGALALGPEDPITAEFLEAVRTRGG
jgi:hypothetical protein